MKFYIAKNQEIKFTGDGVVGKSGIFYMRFDEEENPEHSESDVELVNVFRSMVNERYCGKGSIEICVVAGTSPTNQNGLIQLIDKTRFLEHLGAIYGRNSLSVKVACQELQQMWNPTLGAVHSLPSENGFVTQAMTVRGNDTNCQGNIIQLKDNLWMQRFFTMKDHIKCLLTVEITVSLERTDKLTKENKAITYRALLFEKLLNDRTYSDAVIIPDNGQPVNCNKTILSECSDALGKMFKTDMTEGNTARIEMPDISEAGIKAFLRFVYYLDEEEPLTNCEVAFELLKAADKYDVKPSMEGAMMDIFMTKSVDWYTVDVAIKVFQYAIILPEGEKLKKKAVKMIAQYYKQLSQSPAFNEMFENNPKAAKELFQIFTSKALDNTFCNNN